MRPDTRLILSLAFKNLMRYRRRTFITGSVIALGLMFYILMDSLLLGWFSGTERQYIDYQVASGRIVRDQWWADRERLPLEYSIADTAAVTALLEDRRITYTPRTDFTADLIFYRDPYPEDGSYQVAVTALDPVTDRRVFQLTESMENPDSRGAFLQPGDPGILVGNVLAEKLHMQVGYPVGLEFTTREGYRQVLDTKVTGIIKSGSHMVNLSGVFISLDTADQYLAMEGAVTGYSILLPPGGKSRLRELEASLPEGYRLLGYEEIASEFIAMQEMESGGMGVFLFIIFIIASVGVSNTMMMAVFERRREIGMMRAQGLSDRKIRVMFYLEAAGIGVVGALLGLLLGALLNIPLVNLGLNYGAMLKVDGDVVDFGGLVIDSRMKGVWSLKSFVYGAVFAVVVSSLASFFPVRRMMKEEVHENLRRGMG